MVLLAEPELELELGPLAVVAAVVVPVAVPELVPDVVPVYGPKMKGIISGPPRKKQNVQVNGFSEKPPLLIRPPGRFLINDYVLRTTTDRIFFLSPKDAY